MFHLALIICASSPSQLVSRTMKHLYPTLISFTLGSSCWSLAGSLSRTRLPAHLLVLSLKRCPNLSIMVLLVMPVYFRNFLGLLVANTARHFLLHGVKERRDLTENLLYGIRPTAWRWTSRRPHLESSPLALWQESQLILRLSMCMKFVYTIMLGLRNCGFADIRTMMQPFHSVALSRPRSYILFLTHSWLYTHALNNRKYGTHEL